MGVILPLGFLTVVEEYALRSDGGDAKMQLEQIVKELLVLARRGELGPSHHQRVRMLMRELRMMGMTNAQISELTHNRWAETTIKEYTRGVTVMNSEPWQSTTAAFGEMLSKGLSTEDVKHTIAVRDKLESGGTSIGEITELLAELKRAGIDVPALIALYGELKSSGLTAPDAASALKYKGELEAAGFELGSLSDIAGAAQALGSPEEVLRAIGKYQHIGELDEQVVASQRRLAEEEGKIKDRIEEGEQAIREAEERERSTRERLSQLDQAVDAKAELLTRAKELEKLELDAARLGELHSTVGTIGAKYGLGREEALRRFFDQLKEYDAALGFEAEANRWETIAETNRLESEKIKVQLDGLELKYGERKEAVDAMESLLKHGIKPHQIPTWNRILARFKGPEQFDQELERYKGAGELLKAKRKEIARREGRMAELDAQAKALKQELSEIQGSIKTLSNSGVVEVAKVRDKAIAQLQALLEGIRKETERWGQLKAEAGKLEKELKYGRFLTAADDEVLKAYPEEMVCSFLDRVLRWCKLNNVNPLVKMPEAVSPPFLYIGRGAQLRLVDLIVWAEAGLAGESQ